MFLEKLQNILEKRIKEFEKNKDKPLEELRKLSYTMYIMKKGYDKIVQKFGEEAVETLIEFKNKNKDRIIYETCDLLYFLTLLLNLNNISWQEILKELESRHEEKNKNS